MACNPDLCFYITRCLLWMSAKHAKTKILFSYESHPPPPLEKIEFRSRKRMGLSYERVGLLRLVSSCTRATDPIFSQRWTVWTHSRHFLYSCIVGKRLICSPHAKHMLIGKHDHNGWKHRPQQWLALTCTQLPEFTPANKKKNKKNCLHNTENKNFWKKSSQKQSRFRAFRI